MAVSEHTRQGAVSAPFHDCDTEWDDSDPTDMKCRHQPMLADCTFGKPDCDRRSTFLIDGDRERTCTHVCDAHLVDVLRLLNWVPGLLIWPVPTEAELANMEPGAVGGSTLSFREYLAHHAPKEQPMDDSDHVDLRGAIGIAIGELCQAMHIEMHPEGHVGSAAWWGYTPTQVRQAIDVLAEYAHKRDAELREERVPYSNSFADTAAGAGSN